MKEPNSKLVFESSFVSFVKMDVGLVKCIVFTGSMDFAVNPLTLYPNKEKNHE